MRESSFSCEGGERDWRRDEARWYCGPAQGEQVPSNAADALGMSVWTQEPHSNRKGDPTELQQGSEGTTGPTPNSLKCRQGK